MADGYFGTTVISLTDAKQSALFYEHVIPLFAARFSTVDDAGR